MAYSDQEAAKQLGVLRQALYPHDEAQQQLAQEVKEVREKLLVPENFQEKIHPHLDSHFESEFEKKIAYLQEKFPDLFGKSLATAIKVQIRDSRDEIIDALYPIIGKLISKYLKAEFDRINEQVDARLSQPFSFQKLKMRWKAWTTGIPYDELLLQETQQAKLEQIYVINKSSGLLLGNYSLAEMMHPDMVAGMLTGIKSFAEHAFEKGVQELQTVEYGKSTMSLFDFQTFYFAAVYTGQNNAVFEKKLRDSINLFCEKKSIITNQELTKAQMDQLSSELNSHFHGFNQVDQ